MRVTIGQINTINGDFESNTASIIRAIEQAKERTSISSCCPKPASRATRRSTGFSIATCNAARSRRCRKSSPPRRNHRDRRHRATINVRPPAAVSSTPPRHSQSGTARLCRQDSAARVRRLRRSALLPTSGRTASLPAPDRKLGVAVCEDFWNDKTFWRERLYANDPADELIELGAEVLVSINASPFNKGKMGQRCAMVSHRAKAAKIPIVFVNLVGGNDGVIFDGASIVADARGKIILQAPPFEEFIGTVDLDCDVADKRCLPGDDIETIHDALVLGIRDYARKNGFKRAVLGLSGGIDSAVVAALACEALGAENVLSVMMPSPYSSRSSVDDSVELGRRLGMPVIEHPISNAYEVLLKNETSAHPQSKANPPRPKICSRDCAATS
jgi:NAD+ synthase (glutamine-hydrolysing)